MILSPDISLQLHPVSPADSAAFRAYFMRMAGEDLAMDAFELVDGVNTLLSADQKFKPFTIEATRQVSQKQGHDRISCVWVGSDSFLAKKFHSMMDGRMDGRTNKPTNGLTH